VKKEYRKYEANKKVAVLREKNEIINRRKEYFEEM